MKRSQHQRPGVWVKQDEQGQQMVEFALTFTIFCLLLMALALFGTVFFSYASIVQAAREGSRHLMSHPLLPADPDTFETADQEAIWVVTNSLPLLDWRNHMTIAIMPEPQYRVPGGYVAVEIQYTMELLDLNIPVLGGEPVHLLGPIHLRTMSRRSLD